jgi:DUF971 family protein
MEKHIPTEITLHKKKRMLEIAFNEERFELPCEYLRVYSPSAEVRGHGPGEEKLQLNKEDVNIDRIDQVGTYAIQISYDDNHSSGIYDWNLLYDLGRNYLTHWQNYLDRLEAAGHTRRILQDIH